MRDEQDRIQVPLTNSKKRREAIGKITDFIDDDLITYLTKYAENIFEPKRILNNTDWLKSNKEGDQYFETYRLARGNVIWMSGTKNKIYLFAMDDTMSIEDL